MDTTTLTQLFNKIHTYQGLGKLNRREDLLIPVFENGKILREYVFDEIRLNAKL